ncbi:hypothetical protein Plim_1000 [Planctopirus limnophila DSM 3776]|uniref:Uncharacterized protein n=1 Tax=Planctopirus limnophila (strain ATCC 43296 / DSM 3776 / IFAM 1008 / Mu 290) TaxID=521674 RepID=D5ST75_PLAL2|nr:hypothetical protein [Planctopirus limnophila]ADG66843.1 hypothetical protein Plim_1000 [Planctopirus limnophila DSM 3776]
MPIRLNRRETWLNTAKVLLGLFVLIATGDLTASAADKKSLIYVKDKNGHTTSLLQKVVVTSGKATLASSPKEPGEPIEPWAIFFRIKNEDGSTKAVNGRVRVGDSEGNPLGWIGEQDVREWDTRFVLEPIDPQKERAFELNVTGGGTARQNATPEGKRRYALITQTPAAEKGDDTEYPVVVYAGNVQGVGQQGTLNKQRNDLENVKLELMFVIESTDFMVEKYDNRPLFDYLKDAIRETVDVIREDSGLKGAIKLGFTEYQDNVPKANFTSRLTCDLTDNYDQFLSRLDVLAATELKDDFPDDGLAGLNEAVQKATWSGNSVKHVILLGSASFQLSERGRNPPQSGGRMNLLEPKTRGYNSTGLSVPQLISRARPQGGSDSRARITKTLHAMLLGRDVIRDLKLDDDLLQLCETIANSSDDGLEPIFTMLTNRLGKEAGVKTLVLLHTIQVIKNQRQLAESQYGQLAKNNGEADGIYMAVEPSGAKVTEAARALSAKLKESFVALESVREGKGLPAASTNEISQPLYTLVGAAAEKFKDSPVLTGTATVRDKRGREVAFKKVMVSEQELRHVKSTLDALFTKFKSKSSKADRQDVGSILNDLKEVLAEAGAGQELTAEVKLKDLISDLPLKTAALDTSPADLALMTTEAFKQWLERIEAAVFRIDDLLTSKQDWLTLSEKAVNEKFTFLRLSELP